MTEENRDSPGSLDSGVPGLIDQYRQQRRAWLAQADELVRLRDEVRAAAEREAMDIVTAARRDVRQIVVEARRELMVLTAQLHAAMDAVEQAAPMQIRESDDEVGTEAAQAKTSLGVTREMVLGARREVRGVLDEARAEIEALAAEAPVFPDEQSGLDQELPTINKMSPDEELTGEARIFATPDPPRTEKLSPPSHEDSEIFSEPDVTFSAFDRPEVRPPFISRVLSSSDAPGPRARSALTFVGVFAAVGVLVTTGTVWWLSSGSKRASREPARPTAVTAPVAESTAAPSENSTIPVGAPIKSSTSLTIEARRPSWIRASIDGQPDAGRLYQAGETREIVGAQSVVIRAGNAGAVFVSVNGDKAQPLGSEGAVLSRRYALESPKIAATPATSTAQRPNAPAPASPVTLAVENSGRPAARNDGRAATSTPTAANSASTSTPNPPSKETATSNNDGPAARPDLVVAGQQWLDAYQRRDRQAMSSAGADNITVTDERSTAERFPSWQNGVQRDLDQVELALTGDTALLTARMTERAEGGSTTPHISRVSQIWVRRAGQWRLADVRIMAEARLNQIVR